MVKDKTNSRNFFPLSLKLILLAIFSLLLIAAGAVGFWFFQKNFEFKKKTLVSPEPALLSLPVAQSEESSVPLVSTEPEPERSSVPEFKSDLQLLREAFSVKYSHPVSETEVSINKQTGLYVSGGIHFAGEMGGGWFLAYKQNEAWLIVADGNGTVPCEAIEPYNFPVDMVPECWNDRTSTLITR